MSTFIVITGAPRTGTSLNCLLIKSAIGTDRFVGEDFPSHGKYVEQANPTGFHESQYMRRGIQRKAPIVTCEKTMAIKLLPEAVLATDAVLIDRMVVCTREPRETMYSAFNFFSEPEATMQPKDRVEKALSVYISRYCSLARWCDNHHEIPVITSSFETLHERPDDGINNLRVFMNEGDWSESRNLIKPELYRSKKCEGTHQLWRHAEAIHRSFRNHDWKAVANIEAKISGKLTE